MTITDDIPQLHDRTGGTSTAGRSCLDSHGNRMTGSAEAALAYDQAMDHLVRFRPAVVDAMQTLVTEHPDAPMGHALAAHLHLMSTDRADLAAAAAHLAAMDACRTNEREAAHARSIELWLAGDWHGAARTLDDLLVRWPTDLLALMIGHQLDFFTGDAKNLRDRVGRSLRAFEGRPHASFVRGMHAFGLEESGHWCHALDAAWSALDAHPDDVWALHAAAHAFEMQGHVDEGVAFMRARVGDWGDGNLFTVHNWWHLALYHLELGEIDDVLAIYDERVHHGGSAGVPIEMLDASAMLWRLHLDGVDGGDRFAVLADAWAPKADDGWYAFNDLHAVVALVGAGRITDAQRVVGLMESQLLASTHEHRSNRSMTALAGLPGARAIVAFGRGDHHGVVEALLPHRATFHRFGGSHAQRDLLERTLLESAVRSGRTELAHRLVSERLSVRPTGRFALDRLRRLTRPAGA